MGYGGYNGGGTLITRRSLWADKMRQRAEEGVTVLPSSKAKKRNPKPAKCATTGTAAIKPERTQPKRPPLKKLSPAPAAQAKSKKQTTARLNGFLRKRQRELKEQLAAGILLPTGKPNPDHPANRKTPDDTRR